MTIDFILNGRAVSAEGDLINITLLQWLRREGFTGSKEGCAEGDCGACSVVLRSAEGAWRAINSCLVPMALLSGREVVSVEGVATDGKLHPVQESMVRHHGSQCGYCTPGFICSLYEAAHRPDLTRAWQLDDQLAGNLCRCTGYRAIHDAACEALSERRAAAHPAATATRAHGRAETHSFESFHLPVSLAELLALRTHRPGARLIAGATEMGLELTKKYRRFEELISVEAVPELQILQRTEAGWEVGAAVTLTRVEEMLATEYPALGKMLRLFGSRQIRSRATLGGNLVTASPIGDSAPVLLSLDARLVLASERGERTVLIEEFFVSYRKTALAPDEVLKSVLIPRVHGKHEFFKVSKRREMDISTVAGAFRVVVEGDVVREARLAFGGVAATPARAQKAEAALLGKPWTRATIDAVLPVLASEFTPISDARGTAEYRAGLIGKLLEKFFHEDPEIPDSAPLAPIAPFKEIPAPHESGHKHVTGAAMYVDDAPPVHGELTVWPVMSPHAHARIVQRDASVARAMPGVHAVLLAEDVPGLNDVGAVRHDEILLADKEVFFHGHLVALVVGETDEACRAAAEKVLVEYAPLPAVLNVRTAIGAESFHTDPNTIRRGDVAAALDQAPMRFSGEFEFGGQEHFYLESHAARALPGEDGTIAIFSSTQHPSEIQAVVSHVLGISRHQVSVESPRMGGGFGGKETQGNTPAALAALAAWKTGRPVRVRFNRDHDMMLTGKRHPFLARFEVGHDADGRLLAVRSQLYADGGWSLDLSMAICDRALFHHDNGYYIPAMEVTGRVVKTNVASNTAFRGFGGPQGMLVIEEIVDRVARRCSLAPEVVRERNLYRGSGATNTTHYGQEIGDNRIERIWFELSASAEIQRRREEIAAWNARSPHRKRGLAMTPVKFGISFTVTHLNQAAALVLVYQDGTVQVNHGGTEMGQGLNTKMLAIASRELGLPPAAIRVMNTRTDKVPNTSATAASSGSDLNGAAVKDACEKIRERLVPFAAKMLGVSEASLVFAEGEVRAEGKMVPFADVVFQAYTQRVPLSATGFYATPGIGWDRAAGKGTPFYYFACGAAVSEVEIDGFTGMMQVRRVDILHDCGEPLNEGVDRGQVEGGFVQGMGWLTGEELLWDAQGRLLTHSPDTYKLPSIGDVPKDFRVQLLANAAQPGVVHGSKAVGEPPLMLAISVREAIRDAVSAFRGGGEVALASPSTCEAIWRAIRQPSA
jgi:xanthine dehydrogenase molybdopterin binding subunit/xanthine dehydrogenase small subunit